MRLAASSMLLCLLQDSVCQHVDRGESRAIDLDAVARAYREAARAMTWAPPPIPPDDPLDTPYESGLPACHARATRRASVDELPAEWLGQTLAFGMNPRDGATHVITSTPRLRTAMGGILATPELAARFSVRCAPSVVRILRAKEVEIDEGE